MLSILIPSFNHAAYVVDAIKSARAIDLPGKKIYIIDDASTDNSVAVIEKYLRDNPSDELVFLKKPSNRGAIDSVLTFLSKCTTKYVYFMASDDVAVASGIEQLVQRLEQEPALQFIMGGGSNAFEDGSRTRIYGVKHQKLFGLSPQELVRALFLVDPSPLLCQASVFRLSAIESVGGFDPAVMADDYALFTRLFMAYHRRDVDFAFMPETDCVLYRHHGNNSYRNLPRQAFSHRQVINVTAPAALRPKAAGYKLAYFSLIAMKRIDLRSLMKIAGMVTLRESPWFAIGLFVNTVNRLSER